MTIAETKKKLRQDALDKRGKLAASRDNDAAAARLMNYFLKTFAPEEGTPIAAYWPYRDEIDVRPLLEKLDSLGCNCLLPVVRGRNEALQFHQWKPGDELEASRFGVLEPSKFHPSASPEIVVLPMLAFDRNGYRLGYGGGYYDMTLAALRTKGNLLAIGVAYQEQEIDDIPVEPHDQKVDAVVTDRSVFHIT